MLFILPYLDQAKSYTVHSTQEPVFRQMTSTRCLQRQRHEFLCHEQQQKQQQQHNHNNNNKSQFFMWRRQEKKGMTDKLPSEQTEFRVQNVSCKTNFRPHNATKHVYPMAEIEKKTTFFIPRTCLMRYTIDLPRDTLGPRRIDVFLHRMADSRETSCTSSKICRFIACKRFRFRHLSSTMSWIQSQSTTCLVYCGKNCSFLRLLCSP